MRIWYLAAIVAACFLSIAGGYWLADTKWQAKWSEHEAEDARASLQAAQDAIERQRKLTIELEKAYETAKELQDQYEADRIAAANTAQRLRSEIARYQAAAKADNSSAVSISANAATDRLVLANVLARIDQRAGELADYADANRKAVINCVNEYSALRAANANR